MPDSQHLLKSLQREWRHLLRQSMDRIQHCLSQVSPDQVWWQPSPGQNSIGVLIRHLTGNLQQWVLDGVPNHLNERDRTAEFDLDLHESAELIMARLSQVVQGAMRVIEDLSPEQLPGKRSIQGFEVDVLAAIMHSIPHFVGHTHQITQLTRLQLGDRYRFHWDPDGPRDAVPL